MHKGLYTAAGSLQTFTFENLSEGEEWLPRGSYQMPGHGDGAASHASSAIDEDVQVQMEGMPESSDRDPSSTPDGAGPSAVGDSALRPSANANANAERSTSTPISLLLESFVQKNVSATLDLGVEVDLQRLAQFAPDSILPRELYPNKLALPWRARWGYVAFVFRTGKVSLMGGSKVSRARSVASEIVEVVRAAGYLGAASHNLRVNNLLAYGRLPFLVDLGKLNNILKEEQATRFNAAGVAAGHAQFLVRKYEPHRYRGFRVEVFVEDRMVHATVFVSGRVLINRAVESRHVRGTIERLFPFLQQCELPAVD